MPKISVLTVFKRVGGQKIAYRCLQNQSFEDWEWVQVTPLTATDLIEGKTKVVPDPPLNLGDVWGLNKAYNAGLKNCEGELVVSIQDEVWFPPDGLEKFWFHYQEDKKGCVTGIGDKYARLDKFYKPEVKVWNDPRRGFQIVSYDETPQNNWELNYCSAPLQAFYDIGGFDETFDQYYGWDNVDVSIRMKYFGYRFYMDKTNECRGLVQKLPVDWEEKNAYAGWNEPGDRKKESHFWKVRHARVEGKYPYKLDYLKEVKLNG